MIILLSKNFLTLISGILIFTMILFTGCSSSSVKTIDGGTLGKDCSEIKSILNFKLKTGEIYNEKDHFIYLECADSSETRVICETLKIEDHTYKKQSFSLSEILSAKVKYPNGSNSVLYSVIGGALFIGIIVLFIVSSDKSGRPVTN